MGPDESAITWPRLPQLIKQSEEDLYENAPCGFILTLPDGSFVKANQTFLRWTGHPDMGSLAGKRFRDLLTIGCKIYYETNYAPLLRMQGFLNEVTLDLIGPQDRQVPVLINAEEMKDPAGKVVLVRSTLFNISDRRKYERELVAARRKAEHSEQRLRFLVRAAEMLRQSSDYHQSFGELAQLAVSEWFDGCTIDLLEHGSLTRVAEASRVPQQALPAPPTTGLALLQDPAGPGTFQACAPMMQGERTIGFFALFMTSLGRELSQDDLDLTVEIARHCSAAIQTSLLRAENERSAEALKESHEWLSTTLHSIGDGVIAVNTDSTISFLNPVAASLTGWDPQEARGRPMSEVFRIIHESTGAPVRNPVETALREGTIVLLDNHTALVRRDGTRITIEDSAAPIRNDRGEIMGGVLVFRDVTSRHAADEEQRRTLLRLQEERDVRDKFVATLTHDLRTPITTVRLSAEAILRRLDPAAALRTQATRIIHNVDRADRMIRDLLDANRIRAGEGLPVDPKPCDLSAQIRESVADLAEIHGDRFVFHGPPATQGIWDGAALRRIVENLCNNAVKYGAPRSPIQVTLEQGRDHVVLSVHNQGNPISRDDQAAIFEPYRRTTSAQHGGQRGWGLGLTLVRGVAGAHGGRVAVESSPEAGTTFSVHLPLGPP